MANSNFPIDITTWVRENKKNPNLNAECLELHTQDHKTMIGFSARLPLCDTVYVQLVPPLNSEEHIWLDKPAIEALRDYCNRVLQNLETGA